MLLQRGDSVVLSTDKEVAVATGCLVEISPSSVTVSTDRNVHNWDRNFEVGIELLYKENLHS